MQIICRFWTYIFPAVLNHNTPLLSRLENLGFLKIEKQDMGRGKIDDTSRSQVSFSESCAELLKKAHELSVLCDAEVAVIIFASTGQLYHYASSSVNQVLSRYNKCLELSEASKLQPEAQKKTSDELLVLKEEVAQLKLRQTILLGYDLTKLGLNELQQLEQQLNEGLLSVRERKEQMLMYQLEQSRMKEKQIMQESEQLRKQIKELKSYLPIPSIQPVLCFPDYKQRENCFQKTHGFVSHDKINPSFQEMQIMLENKKIQNQFEGLQSYFPTREQPVSSFLEYSQEKRSFPETHSALGPDAVCKSGAENSGLFTTLQLGTPSHKQRKRKEPEHETAENESISGASDRQFDM